MLKLGIVTMNEYYNYGNKLQAYALQRFLKKVFPDSDVKFVSFLKDNFILNDRFFSLKFLRRWLFNRHNYRELVNTNQIFADVLKEYNSKKFTYRYMQKNFDYFINERLNDVFDYFVIGSDQIWNPSYGKFSELEAGLKLNKKKRISYAASIGLNELTAKQSDVLKKALDNTEHVSVQENKGADIVEQITGIRPMVHVDPTMLLTKEEWLEVAEKPYWFDDDNKYIFVYCLDGIPEKAREKMSYFSEKYNLRIIDIMDKSNLDVYASSPAEFVWLIDNATLVITNSFHGSVFSILMETPFLSFNRSDSAVNMNSRIETLANTFSLQNRFNNDDLSDEKVLTSPGRLDVNNILQIEKARSISYLKAAIEGN